MRPTGDHTDVPAAYFYPKEYIPPGPPFIPYLEIQLAGETKTFTPTDDTYIANYGPSEINGDLNYLATRNRYGGGSDIWECDILIKFDFPRSHHRHQSFQLL